MSNILWTFGDSFTFGHACRKDCPSLKYDPPSLNYYTQYQKKGDNIWVNHLGNFLNYKVRNLGENGDSNDIILDKVIDNIDLISGNDIVIISKTISTRVDIPGKDKFLTNFYHYDHVPPAYKKQILNNFSKDQIESAINFSYYFGDNKLIKDRHEKRFNFILKYLNNRSIKNIFWDVIEQSIKFETISHHTNNKIINNHFSFKGHLDFAKLLYNLIQK